jgi:hypothetical protein
VTGTKRERPGASDWYKQLEEANIHRIEAEWQAKQRSRTFSLRFIPVAPKPSKMPS